MPTLKHILGAVPSAFVNGLLKGQARPATKLAAVDLVNRYPNWFDGVDAHVLVDTEFGFSMYCDRRSGIGQTLLADGKWEGLVSRTIQACLAPGDTAVDIGANIGYDTMLMSQAVGPKGLVLAFEPVAQHLALLLKNARHMGHGNVIAQSVALSDQPGMARIALYGDYNSGMPNLRPGESGPSQPILAARFDTLVAGCKLDRIALVKIDVEGFEFKAIEGMGSALDAVQCLTCEINPAFLAQCGSSPQMVFDFMARHGFTSYGAQAQSNGGWVRTDHTYNIASGAGQHFDALFCRQPPPPLRALLP